MGSRRFGFPLDEKAERRRELERESGLGCPRSEATAANSGVKWVPRRFGLALGGGGELYGGLGDPLGDGRGTIRG